MAHECDVTDEGAVRRMVAACVAALGGVDYLVNVVGVTAPTGAAISKGPAGVPQDPFAPCRGPLGSSPDRERAIGWIGNAPVLVPGPLARLQDLPLLTR